MRANSNALAPAAVRRIRLHAQHLLRPADSDPVAVVRAVAGIQAQDLRAAELAVRARSRDLTRAALDQARAARHLVRTWLMRSTLHLVAAADVRPLLAVLAPAFDKPSWRRAELGLDPATCARGVTHIEAILRREGPLTRADLAVRLAGTGIPTVGQALPHLLSHAALQGVIGQGPDRAGEPLYVLLDEWLSPAPPVDPEAALVALLRRYLAAYAPAGPADFAAWSGLSLGTARRAGAALEATRIPVEVAGQPAWVLPEQIAWLDESPADAPGVRLLPAFDTLLLGYADRGWVLDSAHARQIHPGGGLIHPTLLVDGHVAGSWRLLRRAKAFEVAVTPFAALPASAAAALAAEAAAIGRFLGAPATLRLGSL